MTFLLGIVPLQVLVWPLLAGLGLALLLTAEWQTIGKPKPDLEERLRRLDLHERLQMQATPAASQPIFQFRLGEALLRPLLDDLGRLLHRLFSRVGFAGGDELERTLAHTRPGVGLAQWYGEKLVSGMVGLLVVPFMGAMGIHPFGPWPLWTWGLGFIVGFLAPEWRLEHQVAARRRQCIVELPALLDMLCLCATAGLALEQALAEVAGQSQGVVAEQIHLVLHELALGQNSLSEALEAMAERMAVPEVARVVSVLQAVHEQGLPLVQTLAAQADAMREAKRLRIVEDGGKATVKMLLPVALFFLPVLLVIVLVPAAQTLFGLGE